MEKSVSLIKRKAGFENHLVTLISKKSVYYDIEVAFLLLSIICFLFLANAQKSIYSSPAKDDTRRMNFEIAGKINGNFLIYKNIRNKKPNIGIG
ncbi:MAG: hypothetical protein IPN82_16005 [Chitinophagaceae bacterium]|nr:hypothetical protein [Chitinophagaceae bacterium]